MAKITKLFTNVICDEFLPFVAKETGVELGVLINCWGEFNRGDGQISRVQVPQASPPPPQQQRKVYSSAELNKLKIKDLKAICEDLNIGKTGVKRQIIDKILAKCGVKVMQDDVEPEETKKTPKPETPPKKFNLEKLRAPPVKITQNETGHWIHDETKIVFTADEDFIDGMRCRIAIGYEDEDGTVEDLTAEKIETCNQYGFRYKEPTNIII